jgi:DNA-binding cell septation regulator SpoVG
MKVDLEVKIEWKDGKYPSFNVMLLTGPDKDPFMTIRGCKIIQGQKGEFVSYPARKQEDGKYFNYVYCADVFNRIVLEKANAAKPAESKPSKSGSGFDDMDSDVPF